MTTFNYIKECGIHSSEHIVKIARENGDNPSWVIMSLARTGWAVY